MYVYVHIYIYMYIYIYMMMMMMIVYPRERPPHTRTARAQPPAAHRRRHSRPHHHRHWEHSFTARQPHSNGLCLWLNPIHSNTYMNTHPPHNLSFAIPLHTYPTTSPSARD